MTSAAWISRSEACPPWPPDSDGWWIRTRALGSARRLPGRAGGEQDGGGAGGLAQADGLDLRADVRHGVVDRGHGGEGAARGVDVQRDVAVRVGGLEHQQLGHDVVGGGVVNLDAEEDDAVLEQLGVRVLALEAVGGALFELRQHVAAARQVAGSRSEVVVHVHCS